MHTERPPTRSHSNAGEDRTACIVGSSCRKLGRALLMLGLAGVLSAQTRPAAEPSHTGAAAGTGWLFAGFRGNSEDGVVYALSRDGFHWTLANGGEPVTRQTEAEELMRDPFLQRGPDGSVAMVWTWAWGQPTVLGFSTSDDLVHWTAHRQLPVMANEPKALNAWAPALYYEAAEHRWLLFWSSTIPGRFAGDGSGDGPLNHRIFSTTTVDFRSFAPARVFFDPGFSVIDATLLPTGSGAMLIFKDERKNPLEKHLLTASGPGLEGPWSNLSAPISETWAEGAAILPVEGGYLALYDHYMEPQHYAALFSPDLKTWTDATARIGFPAGMRHGSFLRISAEEYTRLAALRPVGRKPSTRRPAGDL